MIPATSSAVLERPIGLWLGEELGARSAAGTSATAQAVEQAGFGVVWISESVAKEVVAHATQILEWTERIVVGTGIASIWARDAMAMANAGRTLSEAHPDRFVLGLGVSHEVRVVQRGHVMAQPLQTMADYLDAMQAAQYEGPAPRHEPPLVLAALGPRMLSLAAARTAGALTYFVPPAHTLQARAVMGPDAFLAVEQAVVLADSAQKGRQIARAYMERYLQRPNYTRNLQRLGWPAEATRSGGSDDLVDALIAWGDEEAIQARVQEHFNAGADHVCIQPLRAQRGDTSLTDLERLAFLTDL